MASASCVPVPESASVAPGWEIVHATLRSPVPWRDGFARIDRHLRDAARPRTALCGIELRSPEPFTFDGFSEFNAGYVSTLRRWGLVRQEGNPVSRSNVCPVHAPPTEPVFHAFSYTVPLGTAQAGLLTTPEHSEWAPGPRNYVLAGYAEWAEGTPFPDGVVARGDCSPAGLATKAAFVLDTLVARLGEKDRRSVVLRFFQQRSYAELGIAMGISEEAARKRVSRAIEKLRHSSKQRLLDAFAET